MSNGGDKEGKTEEATEKKIRDAIEKGSVPFSKELSAFAALVGFVIVTSFFIVGSTIALVSSLKGFIDDPGQWPLENTADAVQLFGAINLDAAQFLMPAVIVLAIAGLASSLFSKSSANRIRSHPAAVVAPVPERGVAENLGLQGWVEFLKGSFKLSALAVLAYLLARAARFDVFNSMFMAPNALPELMRTMANRLFLAVLVAIVLLVVADLVWSRFFWRRELRMTRQEIKDEQKQAEGDPIIKGRLRSLARDRARKRMMARVPQATVVIANPRITQSRCDTSARKIGAPLVVAKGLTLSP